MRRAGELIAAAAATGTCMHEGQSLPPLTTSIGLAMFPSMARSPRTCCAGRPALYAPKARGRNRVEIAERAREPASCVARRSTPAQARSNGNASDVGDALACPASPSAGDRRRARRPRSRAASAAPSSRRSSTGGCTAPRFCRRPRSRPKRSRCSVGIVQLVIAIGQFQRAEVDLEALGHRHVAVADARQRALALRDSRTPSGCGSPGWSAGSGASSAGRASRRGVSPSGRCRTPPAARAVRASLAVSGSKPKLSW